MTKAQIPMTKFVRPSFLLVVGAWTLVMQFADVGPCAAASPSLRSQVNQATLRVTNPKSSATVFILERTNAKDDPQPLLLVTAAHVFEKAEGDEMRLTFRKRDEDGQFSKVEVPLRIRQDGKNLWTKHDQQDVAVMSLAAPEGIELPRLPLDMLADSETLSTIEAGDLVRSFGFPHAPLFDPTSATFPTVRLGCIASSPIKPTKKQPHFLIDINSHEGDSGGPIVWQPEGKPDDARIIGLTHGQHFINFNYDFPYESGAIRKQLGVAIIVPSTTIRETIEMLEKK